MASWPRPWLAARPPPLPGTDAPPDQPAWERRRLTATLAAPAPTSPRPSRPSSCVVKSAPVPPRSSAPSGCRRQCPSRRGWRRRRRRHPHRRAPRPSPSLGNAVGLGGRRSPCQPPCRWATEPTFLLECLACTRARSRGRPRRSATAGCVADSRRNAPPADRAAPAASSASESGSKQRCAMELPEQIGPRLMRDCGYRPRSQSDRRDGINGRQSRPAEIGGSALTRGPTSQI